MTPVCRRLRASACLALGIGAVLAAHSPLLAQDCLGIPIAPARRALGLVYEPITAGEQLLGGAFRQVHGHLAWGAHAGGVVAEFPPRDPVLAVGGELAFVKDDWFCVLGSVTHWAPEVEFFSREPGDSETSILLFRAGVGLAGSRGQEVRLVAWIYPNVAVHRAHSTFGDDEFTDSKTERLLDLGGSIAGGRFWGTGALRVQFADDPGEDIPFGGRFLLRAGVRF